MKSIYENITDSEYKMLSTFLKNQNSCPADFFFDNPNIDGIVHELSNANLIELDENANISVTELGRSAVVEYDNMLKKRKQEHHFQLMQFWIPTLISVAALIVSVIALVQ